MPGFYEFLEAYRNPKHPAHAETKEWARAQHFRAYDPEPLNSLLKMIAYKKTEWDKIKHENDTVIADKYRKS